MLKMIVLANNDFDGIAAAIAIETAHPMDHVRVELVSNNGVHSSLRRAINAKIPWDRIILADCSIKIPTKGTKYLEDGGKQEELVKLLPGLIRGYVDNGGEFVVIDHHPTAIP